MTHQPPVPAGNQSPYPLQEPPHPHAQAAAPQASVDRADHGGVDHGRTVGIISALAAVGAVALVAGFWAFGARAAKPPKRKGKRRKH